MRHSPLSISATGMEVERRSCVGVILRRLTDLYTSVREAALLKASQRVVFKFRVNYRSHLPNSDNASLCQVPLFCNENLSDNRQLTDWSSCDRFTRPGQFTLRLILTERPITVSPGLVQTTCTDWLVVFVNVVHSVFITGHTSVVSSYDRITSFEFLLFYTFRPTVWKMSPNRPICCLRTVL